MRMLFGLAACVRTMKGSNVAVVVVLLIVLAGVLVVLAHIRGQGCALINANLVRAGGVRKNDKRVERRARGCVVDRAGGRIGSPPIIRDSNGAVDVIEIASRRRRVPGQAAEIHSQGPKTVA